MTQMTVMGSFLTEDKRRLVRSMQQKGDVVAFFGGSLISNTPALKTVDIGITEDILRTMASESSDIIIKAKGSLSASLEFGRCDYHNIKKFSQLQLTICISGLLIIFIMTMSLKESPITALQLIWVELGYKHSWWPNDDCAQKEATSTIPFRVLGIPFSDVLTWP
ncbi:hypothetical protein Ddye_015819 [Dipteronia dyeriana]|uniref:Uncharacterized protein n=1 Tax=Dipteronia dyeriana TaxID=168575 RepID=A0AAD9WZW5_9ROSI|nr:hypothetical protein Ddye_015819 [Dipteronia dyeriana]